MTNDESKLRTSERSPGGRLLVRRPIRDDLDDVFRIHGDPRTNVHDLAGPGRDLESCRKLLDKWLAHWDTYGFGYWVVEIADTRRSDHRDGAVVGVSGVRHGVWLGRPFLNLYYRFVPEAWGCGYASEVARYAVQWATSTHPDLPVLARTRPGNIASRRVAEAVGLVLQPDLEADDGHGPMVVFGQPMAGPT